MSKVKELAKRLSMNPQDAEVAVELVRQCVRNGLFKFKEIGELKGYKIKRIKQQDYLGIGDYFTGQGKTFKKKSKAIERAFDLKKNMKTEWKFDEKY